MKIRNLFIVFIFLIISSINAMSATRSGVTVCDNDYDCGIEDYVCPEDFFDVGDICSPYDPDCCWASETICNDGYDNDCNDKIDCQDSYCDSIIKGYVKDQDNNPLDNAKVEAFEGTTLKKEADTQPDGSYSMDNIACGTYNLAASKTDYIPDTKANFNVAPQTTLENVNFKLTYGVVCEADCTYLSDNACHLECSGVNGCTFYNDIAKNSCNNAKIGWEVEYDADNFVECCKGSPQEITKTKIKAIPDCPYKNLVKFYRIVYYQGKPVRMMTVVCGD